MSMALQDDNAWESWFDEYVPEDANSDEELTEAELEATPNLRSMRWQSVGLAVLAAVLVLVVVGAVV